MITSSLVRMRGDAMNVYVCPSVCLSLPVCQKPRCELHETFCRKSVRNLDSVLLWRQWSTLCKVTSSFVDDVRFSRYNGPYGVWQRNYCLRERRVAASSYKFPTNSPGSTTVCGCHRIQWHEIAHRVGVFMGADDVGYMGSDPTKIWLWGSDPHENFTERNLMSAKSLPTITNCADCWAL